MAAFLHGVDLNSIIGLHGGLLLCAWIGCWLATRERLRFGWTVARGVLGGAIGGLFNPFHFIAVGAALRGGLPHLGLWAWVKTFLILFGEGALLSLPLAILIAVRKWRQPQIEPLPPT